MATSGIKDSGDIGHTHLKHTFGRRLRAVGVSFEDRQDLLGHRSGRITTHYSSAELQNLYEAANKVCGQKRQGIALTLLRNPSYHQDVLRNSSEKVASNKCGNQVIYPNAHKLPTVEFKG